MANINVASAHLAVNTCSQTNNRAPCANFVSSLAGRSHMWSSDGASSIYHGASKPTVNCLTPVELLPLNAVDCLPLLNLQLRARASRFSCSTRASAGAARSTPTRPTTMTGLSIGSRRYGLCDGWWLLMTITMTTTTRTLAKPLKDLQFCMVATLLMFEYCMIICQKWSCEFTHAHVYKLATTIATLFSVGSARIIARTL
jgi:hypothetical protein